MNSQIQKSKKDSVSEFVNAIQAGLEQIKLAGEIAARAQKENPSFIDDVCARHPSISSKMVQRFIDVGNGKLNHNLLLSEQPGHARLRMLSPQIQAKYINEPVDLVVKSNGTCEVLKVSTENLTIDQAYQVFSNKHIRDASEQRAYIESKRLKSYPSVTTLDPYTIEGKKLVINERCQISKRTLHRILEKMQ